ncbi:MULTISPECIES: TonB-dependent siderophore receptor [Achromobacter]|uniref:Ferrichrome outer membrane transporter/phage receptor n=1 Tax=Achromobacter insuavis TaxID=1287735 RepID=A0A6J5A0N1_9BURK|nr:MULTISPECIES: TonB-dependent siderophore receptor [Achromobacter]CAB3649050.1 Ferrichrome outer membrane transporter/phage receptor [Achromobacter insuavis]CUJ13462.1 Ferric hydroxamate uptake [Achromobacter sp. 2789STDY5608628]CUJ71559.1 Ferric hydroxamate uptake [Achromobacter sp. 2789STDY5608633]
MPALAPKRLPFRRAARPARRRAVYPLLLALSGQAGVVFAADEPVSLEAVTVNAYRPAETIGGSTKTDTPLREVPQSVSVIERREMDLRGVRNLNEATRYTAGVLPESQGIDNRVDDLYIRGFDAGSFGANVMLDGLRAPSDSSLSWNRTSFNTWNLERVEVLKGPSSVLYGQLAPGGMVNQVSKLPTLGEEQVVQLQVDGHGRRQTAFDLGGANGDENVLWRLVGLYGDGATQIKHTDHEQWFIAPSATMYFNDHATRLTLHGLYQKDRGGSTFQFLPYQGTVVPAAEGYIKNTTFLGEPDWNTYNRDIWTAGWQLEHQFNDAWKFSQNARYTHVDSLYRATVGNGVRGAALTNLNTLIGGRILNRRAVQGEGDSDAQTIDTRIEGKFGTGPLTHTMIAGFDWQKTDWTFLRQAATVSPAVIAINVYDPVYTHYDFEPTLAKQMSTRETDSQYGVYLQDQIALDRWRFTLGGRQDWTRMDSLNRLTGVRQVTRDEAFTGRAGVTYLFDNGLAPYFSYSESFQPTGGTTRAGSAFKPTTGTQWEAGLKYEPRHIDGMITLSAYELSQQNVLTADPLNEADEAYQVQTGKVRVRGVELEGRITPLRGLSVIGAVTRMDSKVVRNNDGYTGNRMIRVPEWMGSMWVDYTFHGGPLAGLGMGAGVRYVGATYGDLANNLHIPAYTLFDAALRYDAGKIGGMNLQLALNGSNLADKRYVATCSAATSCYYGTGRTVMATARLSW